MACYWVDNFDHARDRLPVGGTAFLLCRRLDDGTLHYYLSHNMRDRRHGKLVGLATVLKVKTEPRPPGYKNRAHLRRCFVAIPGTPPPPPKPLQPRKPRRQLTVTGEQATAVADIAQLVIADDEPDPRNAALEDYLEEHAARRKP